MKDLHVLYMVDKPSYTVPYQPWSAKQRVTFKL